MKRPKKKPARKRPKPKPVRNGQKMARTHGSSKYQHHNTPPAIGDLLHRFGFLALDPCSNRWSLLCAALNLCGKRKSDNGLEADWATLAVQSDGRSDEDGTRRGFVFVNPPYGRALLAWAAKVVREARRGVEVISLTAARHDTAWWRLLFGSASAVAYVRGRIRFYKRGKQQQPAFFPSALLYFGDNPERFCGTFSPIADCFIIERGRIARLHSRPMKVAKTTVTPLGRAALFGLREEEI